MLEALIILRMESVFWKQPLDRWWDDPGVWNILRGCIEQAGWWADFRYESAHGTENFSPIASLDQAFEAWPGKGVGSRTFSVSNGRAALSHFLSIRTTVSGFSVMLAWELGREPGNPDDWRKTWINQVIAGVTAIHAALSPRAWFDSPLNLSVEGFEYPRPRPPRSDPQFGSGVLVDFISLPFHQGYDRKRLDDVSKLRSASLPGTAQRVEQGELLVIRWIQLLSDKDRIAESLSIREQWINPLINPPVAPFYNQYGDREIIFLGGEKRSPLTYYDPAQQAGYQTLYVAPDGSIDEAGFNSLISYLAAHQLPDGSPLEKLFLIVPSRPQALSIYPRAAKLGVSAVYYPDETGAWYDPFSPGLWLEEIEGSPA